jgi:YesN/AraC family two-component response regulator
MEAAKLETLKILIVEDEPFIADGIKLKLEGFGYSHIHIAYNSDKALSLFVEIKPDLVLMDIKLEDSPLNGIALVKIFNEISKVPIIYLSSYTDGSLYQRALDTNPANFLEKNYTTKQLGICIDVAIKNFSDRTESNKHYEYEKKGTSYAKKPLHNRVTFHARNNQVKVVAIEDVVYCLSYGDSTKVFLKNNKNDYRDDTVWDVFAHRNLGYYQEQLTQALGFVRVHNQTLLNINYIDTYNYGECKITLKNGRKMDASRNGIRVLRDYLNKFLGQNTEGVVG